MSSLTRATLGSLLSKQTKPENINGHDVILRKPTPLERAQYQMMMMGTDMKADMSKYPEAKMFLTSCMWIDDSGAQVFDKTEWKNMDSLDPDFYEKLADLCDTYEKNREASATLGESAKTGNSDSPAESASQLGIDDPEAWLDSISDRVFDVWYAYYQCEPFGSHWEQTASVASMLHSNTAMLAAGRGAKMEAAKVVDFMPCDSMPWKKRTKFKTGITAPQAQSEILMKAFGFK